CPRPRAPSTGSMHRPRWGPRTPLARTPPPAANRCAAAPSPPRCATWRSASWRRRWRRRPRPPAYAAPAVRPRRARRRSGCAFYLPSVAFTAITTGPSAFRLATHPVPHMRHGCCAYRGIFVQQLLGISDAARFLTAAPHRPPGILAQSTRLRSPLGKAHLLLLVQSLKLSGRYAYMMCIFELTRAMRGQRPIAFRCSSRSLPAAPALDGAPSLCPASLDV